MTATLHLQGTWNERTAPVLVLCGLIANAKKMMTTLTNQLQNQNPANDAGSFARSYGLPSTKRIDCAKSGLEYRFSSIQGHEWSSSIRGDNPLSQEGRP